MYICAITVTYRPHLALITIPKTTKITMTSMHFYILEWEQNKQNKFKTTQVIDLSSLPRFQSYYKMINKFLKYTSSNQSYHRQPIIQFNMTGSYYPI